MFQALQKRLRKEDEGFTLIELMVVVLIIAILVAIAIPTFLGARSRAQDRAAQSDLRNGLLAAEVWYTDNENYTFTAAQIDAIEPELDYGAIGAASETVVGFAANAAGTQVRFLRVSASGTVFGIEKNEATGTSYCSAATVGALDDLALEACNGASW